VFARSEAYQLKNLRNDANVLLAEAECREFLKDGKTFRFDLYRIPFQAGKGGTPEPLAGASHNGLSNYFPKFSPDGKWIVFCQAKSFMLLQADSELYVLPAEGGQARRLRCNTSRMNSWHSWSPNGKWLVFSSKAFSPYTQLMLTHIDEAGESSVPVVLSRFAASDRAANIPEFVNTKPGAIRGIAAAFLDDSNYSRAAFALMALGRDPAAAIPLFHRAVAAAPNSSSAHLNLGRILVGTGQFDQAVEHFTEAFRLEPTDPAANYYWGYVQQRRARPQEAARYYRRALELNPEFIPAMLDLASLCIADVRADPAEIEQALAMARKACDLTGHKNLQALRILAGMYAVAGQFGEAARTARTALDLAHAAGDPHATRQIEAMLSLYEKLLTSKRN